MPGFDGATGWLNSPPLTAAGLRGSVVLVDFWTYTCINWLRSLPYIRAWSERYEDHGLVTIGVHTPEFPFERDADNVRRAARELRVGYPIAIDSDYAVWRAFDNHYWPALYLADAQGRIRHHRFGEGDYERSERAIQHLLGVADQPLVSIDATGLEAGADWAGLESPETYLGLLRTEGFASPDGAVFDAPQAYAAPAQLELGEWALSGEWTLGGQAAALNEADGRIVFRFHARDLHLVMAPAGPGTPVRFRVRLDGQPPGDAHGLDVDEHGDGILAEPRLHQLIRAPGPTTDRTFEIAFADAGAQAYVFTFG